MAFVGEALVTKIIEKVIDVGFSYLADRCCQTGGMKEELQRLEVALPRIMAVAKAADNAWTFDQQTDNPGLQAWLQQFKDALYEADDALDELEYLRLQKQVEADDDRREGDHNKVPHCFSNSKQNVIKFGKRFFKPDPTLTDLRRAVKRLDEVAARVGDFVALVSSVQQSHHQQHQSRTMISRETGSLVTETKVFGRDREREELLQWLMMDQSDQDEKNNVSLYSVVGVGGMGKTTLVQDVYNDENVQKYFDLKMWVCVSTSFDVKRITTTMLESATKKRPEIDNLATLQDALKDKLMSSNKFLLVLDDVWDDQKNCTDWDNLLAPLRHGHKGSKIMLTTRMDKVAKEAMRAMGGSTKEYLKLKPIQGDDFFSMFNRYAFAGISPGDYQGLQSLGTKIAERLGGSPLAAKIIGALLNSKLDERYWGRILHCKNITDQGQQQQREGNIKSILMLSYHHLPLNLRPCFAFCGSFPQDYEFDKEDIVLKWMALGLIQHSPQNQEQAPEDIGSDYFDGLLDRSFFEQKKVPWKRTYYIMHDLLHDVARSVSHGECFSTIVYDDKSVEDIPNTVRHMYLGINNPNIVMKVDKWQQLRSLQLIINSPVLPEILEKVIKSLKCVRVLEVRVDGIRVVLPDVFGDLRHLRSLKISGKTDKYPASVCKLHNLQVLKLTIKDSTAALPENMKNLISLRHLVMTSSLGGGRIYICPVIIARVRRLASLQVLHIYIKKEREYKIDELEGLNMIRELHLDGLENVESREEARMAKLGNKEHLRVLTLKWSGDNDTEMDEQQQEQILDCLQPHSSLKELTIVGGYKGVRLAKWMDFELVNNLQRISLFDCSRLEHLPSFAKLPFLKYLYLTSMPLVKQLHCDCQQLEELRLGRMQGLEELSQSDGNSGQWCPRLRKLEIQNCPKLSVLPSLSLSLKSVELWEVGLTALPKLWLDSKGSSSSLQILEIHGCIQLTSLDKGLLLQQRYLTALMTLKICNCDMLVDFELVNNLQRISLSDCSRLEHLPSFGKLPFLKYLSLSKMPLVKQLHCDCQQLEELHLNSMEGLEELSESDGNSSQWCPCLCELQIRNCPKLSVFPSLSLSLKSVTLQNVGLTALPKLWLDSKGTSSSSSSSLPSGSVRRRLASLDWLTILDCEELMSLEVISALQHLGRLEIRRCPKLVSTATTAVATGSTLLAVDKLMIDDPMLLLKDSLFRNLTSLRELSIENRIGLESISGEMEEWLLQRRTTLNILTLVDATSLKSLPDSLQTFSSLEDLTLFGAGELQSVPRLPSSVRRLYILGCNETLKDRCRKDEGADWPNINHIPHIRIV